jgi:tyrosyl-tRNA synthetase
VFRKQVTIAEVEIGINIVDVLNNPVFSNGETRRALTANSVSVNKTKVTQFVLSLKDLINNEFVLIQERKEKNYFVCVWFNFNI